VSIPNHFINILIVLRSHRCLDGRKIREATSRSLVATFACQLDDLEQHYSATSGLLRLLSYFDPENMPVDTIVPGAGSLPSQHKPWEIWALSFANSL
jgi:hypothetical protein